MSGNHRTQGAPNHGGASGCGPTQPHCAQLGPVGTSYGQPELFQPRGATDGGRGGTSTRPRASPCRPPTLLPRLPALPQALAFLLLASLALAVTASAVEEASDEEMSAIDSHYDPSHRRLLATK